MSISVSHTHTHTHTHTCVHARMHTQCNNLRIYVWCFYLSLSVIVLNSYVTFKPKTTSTIKMGHSFTNKIANFKFFSSTDRCESRSYEYWICQQLAKRLTLNLLYSCNCSAATELTMWNTILVCYSIKTHPSPLHPLIIFWWQQQ
jgi:hypothetical protein